MRPAACESHATCRTLRRAALAAWRCWPDQGVPAACFALAVSIARLCKQLHNCTTARLLNGSTALVFWTDSKLIAATDSSARFSIPENAVLLTRTIGPKSSVDQRLTKLLTYTQTFQRLWLSALPAICRHALRCHLLISSFANAHDGPKRPVRCQAVPRAE